MTINAMIGKKFRFRKDYIDEEGNCIVPAGSVLKMLRVMTDDDGTIMCHFRDPSHDNDLDIPDSAEETIPVKFGFVIANCISINTIKMVQLNLHEKEEEPEPYEDDYEEPEIEEPVKEEPKMQNKVSNKDLMREMENQISGDKLFLYESRKQVELFAECAKKMDINDYRKPGDEYPRILEDLVENYNNLLTMIEEMQDRVGYLYKAIRMTNQILKDI